LSIYDNFYTILS